MAAILTAVALIGSPVYADDVVRQLPKDGTWVRYHMTEKWADGTEGSLQFRVSLVGQTIVEGEKCCWIELRIESDEPASGNVFKWLVSRKQLEVGGAALANAHRAWRKTGEKEVSETDLNELFARLYLFVPPPLKNAKKSGKMETVEWQEGRLNCDVAIVRTLDEFPAATTGTIYHLRLHKRVPFGVAAAKLTVDSVCDRGTIEYSLIDMGTNAKSDIPEAE